MSLYVLAAASAARAGAILELVPDQPGPYSGGETIAIQFWLETIDPPQGMLQRFQLDFSSSSPQLGLDLLFMFDFSTIPDGVSFYQVSPQLPVPSIELTVDCVCPGAFIPVNAAMPVHMGSLDVTLPTGAGVFTLDAMNADAPDTLAGAHYNLRGYPLMSAHAGNLLGGRLDFVVVPEPSSLCLLFLGLIAAIASPVRRKQCPSPHRVSCSQASVRWTTHLTLFFGILAVLLPIPARAQPADVPSYEVSISIDSGLRSHPGSPLTPLVLFSEEVGEFGAPWIQLHFDAVTLSGSAAQGNAAYVRITSMQDGATQIVDEAALQAWANSSCYFNGQTLLVELVAYPSTGDNRFQMDYLLAGDVPQAGMSPEGGLAECVGDDRVPSTDRRTCRILPVGCTGFLFEARSNCFLTAGHCNVIGTMEVIEFNVPLSLPNGTIQHPGPADQYPVDPASIVFQYDPNASGRDWSYFCALNNSQTGISPLAAQGSSFRLAESVPTPSGEVLSMIGYGVDDAPSCTPPPCFFNEYSQTEQTDQGTFVSLSESTDAAVIRYGIHTRPGNSGSPVDDPCRGLVYGIHTNSGCAAPSFANIGTAIDQQLLQAALSASDCNGNGIPDFQDIASAHSEDCTGNGRPDECEPDCNHNGIADSCDIAGASNDVNDNLVPDECENILHVDASATGANDGSSWQNAYTALQAALNHSNPCGVPIVEIWVASGSYAPASCIGGCTSSSLERAMSFILPSNIPVYGGFPPGGGNGAFEARQPATYPTILSGDLDGDDDPPFGNSEENAYQVARTSNSSLLDGFIVQGGNANGSGPHGAGGGLMAGDSATIRNCTIRGNQAKYGGGAYCDASAFTNCLFTGNRAESDGGAVAASLGNPTFVNCTFTGNHAGAYGGGIVDYGGISSVRVRNSILWGNTVDEENFETLELAQILVSFGQPSQISYSRIQGFSGDLCGSDDPCGFGNAGTDPRFVDADGADDVAGTVDDDLRLSPTSPAIDAAQNSVVPAGTTVDLGFRARFRDITTVTDTGSGTPPIVDIGAYELPGGACCNPIDCHQVRAPEDCGKCNVAHVLPSTFAGCYGDADGNGVVNAGDRGFISANIGQTAPILVCRFDMDGNGTINAGDRGFVAANIRTVQSASGLSERQRLQPRRVSGSALSAARISISG